MLMKAGTLEQSGLQPGQEVFRQVMTQIGDAVIVTDVRGQVEFVNPAFERVTGYEAPDVLGKPLNFLKSGRHEPAFYGELWRTILAGRVFEGVFANRRRNGEIFFEHKTISPIRAGMVSGEITHFVATSKEITRRIREEDRLRHLAHHDVLTGLPNRTLFLDRLERALLQARRECHGGALLCLDLDRFKPVNDTWGHLAGDEILCQVAQRLQACLREIDTVARVGGDEFAIILNHIDGPAECAPILQKLLMTFDAPFELANTQVDVGASIGVAYFCGMSITAQGLLELADINMYRMKRCGGSACRVFHAELRERKGVRS